MELKDFIKTALIDLITGVDEAKLVLKDQGGSFVCPPLGHAYRKEFDLQFDAHGRYYQKVEFDVAVTVENTDTGGAKAGIKVMGLEASLGGNLTANSSTASRVKFHVPIALQCVKLLNEEQEK